MNKQTEKTMTIGRILKKEEKGTLTHTMNRMDQLSKFNIEQLEDIERLMIMSIAMKGQ